MNEIQEIMSRYDETYVSESLKSLENINKFTGTFVKALGSGITIGSVSMTDQPYP
jgi:hypothetical protein